MAVEDDFFEYIFLESAGLWLPVSGAEFLIEFYLDRRTFWGALSSFSVQFSISLMFSPQTSIELLLLETGSGTSLYLVSHDPKPSFDCVFYIDFSLARSLLHDLLRVRMLWDELVSYRVTFGLFSVFRRSMAPLFSLIQIIYSPSLGFCPLHYVRLARLFGVGCCESPLPAWKLGTFLLCGRISVFSERPLAFDEKVLVELEFLILAADPSSFSAD